MSKVETGPAVTMTQTLLEELAVIDTLPTTPPDGYASVHQIEEATGLSNGYIYDSLRQCHSTVILCRPANSNKAVRYYSLAEFVAYRKRVQS